MANNEDKLFEIFNSDSFGLLETKAKPKAITTDDRLVASFEEINYFYKKHDKEPEKTHDMTERKLFSRLLGMRESPDKIEYLKSHDKYKLLDASKIVVPDKIESVDDIFNSKEFNILSDSDEDIFSFKHTPKQSDDRLKANAIAQRQACDDFDKYAPLFKICHSELRSSKRRIIPYIGVDQLEVGGFCVLAGVVMYIAEIFSKFENASKKDHRVTNRRTLLIFENGTKSNMLLRSLDKALRIDGQVITKKELFDYLPKNAIVFMDESHVSVPQIGGMYKGDRSRKETLVDYGFRLPSALDNRPLRFEEWEEVTPQKIYVTATPSKYE